jgi:endo-1,4-beta-xylanase
MKALLITLALLCASAPAFAQEEARSQAQSLGEIPLWTNGAPGPRVAAAAENVRITDQSEHVVSGVRQPTITPFLPTPWNATGAAIIIAPGGGHRELWSDHEGHNVAKWLVSHGVAGFVLKYRLAREKESTYTVKDHALADTRRAIRLVRQRAAEWRVSPGRVGVMGFSAGGELAALAGLQYDAGDSSAADPIERQPSRPDFQALIYPAIPRDGVLAKEQPPAFLACGENDRKHISQGLPELYLKMKQAELSAELHVYAGAGHGFGLRERNTGPSGQWIARFHDWLGTLGMLKRE